MEKGAPPQYNPQPMYPQIQQPPPGGVQYSPQQPTTTTVVTVGDPAGPRWSWGNLVLATISLCCCWCFGLVAFIAAMLAYVDHKVKDFPRSEKKKKIAMGFGIAGIVIGSIITLILIIQYAVVIAAIVNAAKDEDRNSFGDFGN